LDSAASMPLTTPLRGEGAVVPSQCVARAGCLAFERDACLHGLHVFVFIFHTFISDSNQRKN
jgi:hypothetical protein